MAWTNGDFRDTYQKPFDLNQHGCYLQVYRRGHHRFISHHSEGLCNYTKVLSGRLIFILPRVLLDSLSSHTKLYEDWCGLTLEHNLLDDLYKKYIKRPFDAVVLNPGDYMWVFKFLF